MPKVFKKTPLVSIFVPTGNRAKDLQKVLASLTTQVFKDFEVLVVDYKSGPDTFNVIKKYSSKIDVSIIHQTEKGLSKAANLALQKAKGKYFIRTDDDVAMSKEWLKSIVETFERDKKVGGVTGPTIVPDDNVRNRDVFLLTTKAQLNSVFWRLVQKLHTDFFLEHQPFRVSHWCDSGAFSLGTNFSASTKEPMQEVNNLEACNYAVQTKLLRKVGGFDQVYSGVGEYHEPDAAFKIKNMGYKLIFNPKAKLNHMPSRGGFFNDRPDSYSRMVNFIVFYMRHLKPNTARKFLRFSLYILFQDGYYVYQALKTGQLNQLGALIASATGFYEYWKTKPKNEYEN